MLLLLVGDVHAVPAELDECWRLAEMLRGLVQAHRATPVLLGDQHHSHGVVHLPVISFWRETLASWQEWASSILVVGNHDKGARDSAQRSVMDAYRDLAQVVDSPLSINGVDFISHDPDPEEFVSAAAGMQGKTLVCHQTFLGSSEDGRPLADGIDPGRLPHELVISGHVHAPQQFGKVWYPGAPRWRTLTDAAAQERAVYLAEFDGGRLVQRRAFGTSGACRPIRRAVESYPDETPAETFQDGADWRLVLRGPAAWVNKRREQLAGLVRVDRVELTDTAPLRARESEGLSASFERHMSSFRPSRGTSQERLRERLQEVSL